MAEIHHADVAANGIVLHVASSGPPDAPEVLCLHGFPEGWMVWRPIMQRLTEVAVYAPDLRGYPGSQRPASGYDVITLTDDIAALIEALGLERPLLVGDDWGGELAWIFAHRYGPLIRGLVAVNGPHPRTLERAVVRVQHGQTFTLGFVIFFQIPGLPEWLATTRLGRRLLRWSFTAREGRAGAMDRALVDELVARFREPVDFAAPLAYYRELAAHAAVACPPGAAAHCLRHAHRRSRHPGVGYARQAAVVAGGARQRRRRRHGRGVAALGRRGPLRQPGGPRRAGRRAPSRARREPGAGDGLAAQIAKR